MEYRNPFEDDKDRTPEIPEIQAKELPLRVSKVPVTRFNRKVVILLIALIGGFTSVSLIWAFSPKKEKTAEEVALEQQENAESPAATSGSPTPPEAVVSAPATYADMGNGNGVPAGVPQLGRPLAGDVGGLQLQQQRELEAAQQMAAAGGPAYTAYPVGAGGQITPDQQAAFAAQDQRRKDADEARRSPLAFGGGQEFARQGGHSAAPASSPGPNMDQLSGVADKLANLAGGGMPQGNSDPNMQDEKRGFARDRRKDSPYLEANFMQPVSPYEIKAGSIFPGVLITGINSDLPGQIIGQVRENVYDTVSGRYLLVPQGTRLIGEYDSKVAYGQQRALIVWTRLIMPNGDSISLEGMPGTDLRGYAGLTDRVNNHYGRLLSGVVLGSVLGAAAQVAVGPAAVQNPSFDELAVAGAAQNINDAGQQITKKNLNIQPTIEIRPGMKFNVFVTKDMILRPYRGK